MKSTTRIIIVDDHPFFSDGIINALQPYQQYQVAGAFHHGHDVLPQVKNLCPDIIILDINLPGITGLELLTPLKKDFPQLKIMLLSMYMPSDVQLGPDNELIDAYVLKNSGTETLLAALQELTAGKRFFDPTIKNNNHHSQDKFSQQLKLSSREKDIIRLLKEGLTNREVAAKLFISELTVKTHRKNIMAKLGVRNLAALLKKI
jgi:DNA-binding NarL/FixJ family response regulator